MKGLPPEGVEDALPTHNHVLMLNSRPPHHLHTALLSSRRPWAGGRAPPVITRLHVACPLGVPVLCHFSGHCHWTQGHPDPG